MQTRILATLLILIATFGLVAASSSLSKTIIVAGGSLSPATLEVHRGEKVIWVIADQPVSISFVEEGTVVPLTCASSTPVYVEILPPDTTLALCFIEPGTYNYLVFIRAGPGQGGLPHSPLWGRIIVR